MEREGLGAMEEERQGVMMEEEEGEWRNSLPRRPGMVREHIRLFEDMGHEISTSDQQMPGRGGSEAGRGKAFRGSALVDTLLESYPGRLHSRAEAVRLARVLHRERLLASVFGAKTFEDSGQLYTWRHDSPLPRQESGAAWAGRPAVSSRLDRNLVQVLQQRMQARGDYGDVPPSGSSLLHVKGGTQAPHSLSGRTDSQQPWDRLKRESDYSTDSSVDTRTYYRSREVTAYALSSERGASGQPSSDAREQTNGLSDFSNSRNPQYIISGNTARYQKSTQGHTRQPRLTATDQQTREISSRQHIAEYTNWPRSDPPLGSISRGENLAPRPQHPRVADRGSRGGRRQEAGVQELQIVRSSETEASRRQPGSEPERDPRPLSFSNRDPGVAALASQGWDTPRTGVPPRSHWSSTRTPRMERPGPEPGPQRPPMAGGGGEERGEVDSGLVEASCSYSDNEKQLLEEMKRMKQEHQSILKTYEGRINKLMAKMHELRSIAEMLENSSTKSSPYGLLPQKLGRLAALAKSEEDSRPLTAASAQSSDVPPPLPPRPGRGGRVYPNKPIVTPRVSMQPLPWVRLILSDTGEEGTSNSVWQGLQEPVLDTEEVERLFHLPSGAAQGAHSLYDDVVRRRGRTKSSVTRVYEAGTAERLTALMQKMTCTVEEVTQALASLELGHLDGERLSELLALMSGEAERVLQHCRRKSPGQLDCPELLLMEFSRLDHFRERMDFLCFKHRLYSNLFEIDQQLNEVQTACEEVSSNTTLRGLLQTVLAVGNYMNGTSDSGQADGFNIAVLSTLKNFQDRTGRGTLLQLVVRLHCRQCQTTADFTGRFPLPEPSTMRHAAQVSFDEIEAALADLNSELVRTRQRLESLSTRENITISASLRVSGENFLAAALEVLWEQERHLEDTRSQFCKTTAFFLFDHRQEAPSQFFQVWASFLHDAKYAWKLALRTLARDRFLQDFSSKTQLSACSIPGLAGLKARVVRQLTTVAGDAEARAAKAQHLRHINSWLESVGRYTMEIREDQATGIVSVSQGGKALERAAPSVSPPHSLPPTPPSPPHRHR